jgi:hypothetical protein
MTTVMPTDAVLAPGAAGGSRGLAAALGGLPRLWPQWRDGACCTQEKAIMASIRKRSWTTNGERREAWQVDFIDQDGNRHQPQFARRSDADEWLVAARAKVQAGTYTPDAASATVGEAIELWLNRAFVESLEQGTRQQYRLQPRTSLRRSTAARSCPGSHSPGASSYMCPTMVGRGKSRPAFSFPLRRPIPPIEVSAATFVAISPRRFASLMIDRKL